MKMKWSSCFFLLFSCLSAPAQSTVTVNELLASARTDPAVQMGNRAHAFMENNSFTLPLLNRVWFRTETHDFEFREQEYMIRARFNGFRAQKQQRRMHQAMLQASTAGREATLAEALRQRYRLAVGLMFVPRLLEQRRALEGVYRDKVRVLREMVSETNFDITDLIEAEDELEEQSLEILQLEEEHRDLLIQLSFRTGKEDIALQPPSSLPSPEEVKAHVTERPNVGNHPDVLRRQASLNMVAQELELEKTQTWKLFDFVQARYGGNNRMDYFREAFSVGVGFRFPESANSRLKINNLMLEQLEEESKTRLLENELAETIARQAQLVDYLYRRYQLLNRQLEESQAAYSLPRYQSDGEATALDLLKIQESLLRRRWAVTRTEQDIFLAYVEWLAAGGLLTALPLRNYLNAGRENF